jgi:hypothetical protein
MAGQIKTRIPSLRAKRSNPALAPEKLDCFVVSLLAMTPENE